MIYLLKKQIFFYLKDMEISQQLKNVEIELSNFVKVEILTKAISLVHQSKVKWFSEETLKGSILSILLISEWYKELNLIFAAKYYALAAAFISSNSSDPKIISYMPKALI